MPIIKALISIIKKRNPIKYARELGVSIGENTRLIGMANFGSEPYLISIGNHVTVSYDVTFITHDGGTWVFRDIPKYKDVIKYGKIVIEDNCFIGMKSILMPGITIGANSVIAAGSIVTKNVPPNSVWGGVPAKFITTTEEYADKSLGNMPKYDVENYRINKREEILKMLEN